MIRLCRPETSCIAIQYRWRISRKEMRRPRPSSQSASRTQVKLCSSVPRLTSRSWDGRGVLAAGGNRECRCTGGEYGARRYRREPAQNSRQVVMRTASQLLRHQAASPEIAPLLGFCGKWLPASEAPFDTARRWSAAAPISRRQGDPSGSRDGARVNVPRSIRPSPRTVIVPPKPGNPGIYWADTTPWSQRA
jgi:hypothetical protein